MANITRFNPLALDEAFDDLFRGFFVRPINFEGLGGTPAHFRVDITEDESAYTLRAELPGVKKDDISITVDGDQVAVSAEVRNEKDVKDGGRFLRSERHYGKLYRAFTLGQPVDEGTANAKYADGILEVTLPKKSATTAKRIAIH
jgi:HSP20 family protein